MRKFALINARGARYDLNDLDFFLYDPDGLGMERGTTYTRIGSQWKAHNDSFQQKARGGTMRFKEPDSYQKYYDFVRFAQQGPLRLEYTPTRNTYYMDCLLGSIEKTEIEGDGLHCRIQLTPLTLFYKSYTVEAAGGEVGGGKEYEYTYPYIYSDSAQGTVSIDSDSSEESPCKITIYGPLVNPRWYHYVNNVQYEWGYLIAEIVNGHRLVIDTTKMPYSITEQDSLGNVIYDRYGNSDFSTERFFLLQYGHNRISVGHSGANVPHLIVEGRLQYASV